MRSIARSERGAVSIFIVIFTALLIAIVTVGFMRLMIREQQNAADNDLSQSAYDAALAGVEDAKRALSMNPTAEQIAQFDQCNGITSTLGITPDERGVPVGNSALHQHYTCVKVQTATPSYEKTMNADTAQLVPLRANGSFNQVRIEWFTQDDTDTVTLDGGSASTGGMTLDPQSEWPSTRPPLLETQLIQTAGNFSLSDFDKTSGSGSNIRSNTNSLFLYPKDQQTDMAHAFTDDIRRDKDSTAPTPVKCSTNRTASPYACSATVTVPKPHGGNRLSNSGTTFLRITPRYNGAYIKVTLLDTQAHTPKLVDFNGVQPIVDSTGRADDLFRRVRAAIEPAGGVYPEAAVDITGSFCKTFRVTDRTRDYNPGECFPGYTITP